MTLREALDLLELNERTLEQSMLESSLHNRLEHTELRHVLRVFEAYRKVNAFLNPSFNTQGDARMTIIDESVPGGPMLEVTKAAVPLMTNPSVMTLSERDTFSDALIETSTATDVVRLQSTAARPPEAAHRTKGVNLLVMFGLVAAAFSVGLVVLGPTMSLIYKPSSAQRPAPSVSSLAPVVTAPPVAPVVAAPPSAPVVVAPPSAPVVVAPPSAPVVRPSAPVARPAPSAPIAAKPAPPIEPALPKAVARKATAAKSPVAVIAQVKPRVTLGIQPRVTPASQPRVTAPRVATRPRVVAAAQPRLASRRAGFAPRAASRAPNVAVPSRRIVNQRQFANWDNAGVVLRYRSWTLVPDAVRGLSKDAFRTAVFVARNPASLPDISR